MSQATKSESQTREPFLPKAEPFMWMMGYCSNIFIEHYTPKKIERLILLNAPVLPRRAMVIVSEPTTIENVRALVRVAEKIYSYIGHESTAQLLTQLLEREVPVNRGEYEPAKGDIAVVVRLKRRLQSPQDLKEVKPEDLEFHIISYEDDTVRG